MKGNRVKSVAAAAAVVAVASATLIAAPPGLADTAAVLGQCYLLTDDQLASNDWPVDAASVPCDQPHNIEMTFVAPSGGSPEAAAQSFARNCSSTSVYARMGIPIGRRIHSYDWAPPLLRRYYWITPDQAQVACGAGVFTGPTGVEELLVLTKPLSSYGRMSRKALSRSIGTCLINLDPLVTVECKPPDFRPASTWWVYSMVNARRAFGFKYPGQRALIREATPWCGIEDPESFIAAPTREQWDRGVDVVGCWRHSWE